MNNKKIKIIKDNKTWKYNFKKEGKYNFEIVFNDFINDLERFFDNCIHIISLDLSNFNSSNIINCKCMFAVCANLKKIIGINKLNTNKVIHMETMFQKCYELDYLDLSNFNTENVTNMSYMFTGCNI